MSRTCLLLMAVALLVAGLVDPSRAEDQPLRVEAATFNIRLSRVNDGADAWEHRKQQVVETIRRMNADFVGVQEAWPEQTEYLQEHLPEFRHLVRSREADPVEGESVPLFYRHEQWRIDEAAHGHFWLSDAPSEPGSRSWGNAIPRMVTWGRFVEKATGRGIYVFNTHFDHRSEDSRRKSAEMMARRIAEREGRDPVILMGDFNAGESSHAIRHLRGDGSDASPALIDTFRLAQPKAVEVGTFGGFRGTTDGEKIDYIFASRGVEVSRSQIIRTHNEGRYPSDHYPVTASLAFPYAEPTQPPTGEPETR